MCSTAVPDGEFPGHSSVVTTELISRNRNVIAPAVFVKKYFTVVKQTWTVAGRTRVCGSVLRWRITRCLSSLHTKRS